MKDIVALDGSTLEFVHINSAKEFCARNLAAALRKDIDRITWLECVTPDFFEALRNTVANLWFICRKDQDAYIGIGSTAIPGHGQLVMNVGIHPDYRGNGYGRAAIISMCEFFENHQGCEVTCVIDGSAVHTAFCKSLGMKKEGMQWKVKVRDILLKEVPADVCEDVAGEFARC